MTGRADYTERRENHIDNLNTVANRASAQSNEAAERSHNYIKDIPFGQPNINGSLTSAINKSQGAIRKSIKLDEKASYYSRKAESAENSNAISSDNPEALELLQTKIEKLEANQTHMKKINAYYRKHKTCKGFGNLTDEEAQSTDDSMKTAYSWETAPFPSYALTNNNAKIKSAKLRIKKLESTDKPASPDIIFTGGKIVENTDINRIQILFDEKPADEQIKKLKSRGFHWSPREKAWQRLRSNNAIFAAEQVII